MEQKKYIQKKTERREVKKKDRRGATAEEVLYIFEKVLEGWKTIRIYNTIIQNNPASLVDKKIVENISTGNSKVYTSELSNERFEYYTNIREKVYNYHKEKKNNNNNIE
jgi:anthranilate phosphoribosyltransferase